VASQTRAPGGKLHREVRVSQTELHEGDSYDMAALRIRILDEYGNTAPYAQLPVHISHRGQVDIVGPETVVAEGGMCGAYVKTVGRRGKASVTVSCPQTEPVTVAFTIEKD
jgi:beta-galactosidase